MSSQVDTQGFLACYPPLSSLLFEYKRFICVHVSFSETFFLTKNVILLSFSLPFSEAKAKSRNTLSYNPFWEFKWIKSSGRIAFFKIIHLFYPSSNSFPWFIYGFYSFVSVLSVLSRATLKMGQPLVSLYRCFNLFFSLSFSPFISLGFSMKAARHCLFSVSFFFLEN